MPKEIISTPEAPQSPMYSQAVKAGNTIYVAGTTGVDVTTGEFAGATVKEQARQSLRNCQAILRAAGATLSDAVMVHTLLMRPEDADDLAEVFDELWRNSSPTSAVAAVTTQLLVYYRLTVQAGGVAAVSGTGASSDG